MGAEIRYLPVVRRLPDVGPRELAASRRPTRRLLRLAAALAGGSVVLTAGTLALWGALGDAEARDGRGPWPLLLGIAFSFGLLGAGCCITALAQGASPRRGALAALCLSLVAPVAVGLIALALFFASASLSLGA